MRGGKESAEMSKVDVDKAAASLSRLFREIDADRAAGLAPHLRKVEGVLAWAQSMRDLMSWVSASYGDDEGQDVQMLNLLSQLMHEVGILLSLERLKLFDEKGGS
jgi:hypothetical protein